MAPDFNRLQMEANVNDRAHKLFTELGYSWEADTGRDDMFLVHRPDGKTYRVYLTDLGLVCGCAFHQQHRFCKHSLGLAYELERLADEAQVAQYEAQQREAEHSLFGCDPYEEGNWTWFQGGGC